jgi:multiple sugar transport system permease protein
VSAIATPGWMSETALAAIAFFSVSSRTDFEAKVGSSAAGPTGYAMVLYLAGLKAVDPSLREAALIDGASGWRTFWRVIFPVLRPINIVILVVTVIESLRAFDLVYITNGGTNGLELLSALVTQNIVGEVQRIGFGSSLGVVLLVPISIFLVQMFRREGRT